MHHRHPRLRTNLSDETKLLDSYLRIASGSSGDSLLSRCGKYAQDCRSSCGTTRSQRRYVGYRCRDRRRKVFRFVAWHNFSPARPATVQAFNESTAIAYEACRFSELV